MFVLVKLHRKRHSKMKVFQLRAVKDSLDNFATFDIYCNITMRGHTDKVAQILTGKVKDLSYVHVANVPDYYTKEMAFELTNSIHEYWGDNEFVEDLTTGCRSTSVGDIIEDQDENLFLVCIFGFEQIN
jgi:hypothetical protein